MAEHDIKALLNRLHEELARTRDLDAESRRLLGVVVADIEKLERSALSTPGRLEALAVRFEVQHPTVPRR